MYKILNLSGFYFYDYDCLMTQFSKLNKGESADGRLAIYFLFFILPKVVRSLLLQGSEVDSPNNPSVTKTLSYTPQTDSKVLLLKTTLIELIEHGEVKLVLTYSLHPYLLRVFDTLQATK